MATAAALDNGNPTHGHAPGHGPATRPNMTSVGTIVWLGSELMFFAGVFAIYFTLRAVAPQLWELNTPKLNVPFASINTLILVISSFTCQWGVMKAERGIPARTGSLLQVGRWGMREWFVLTYILGSIFIAGQVMEYAELVHHGMTMQADSYASIFYFATGLHGIHVLGGLMAFLLIIGRTFTTRHFSHAQATGAVVVSYYWHFVDVVWVALFATIYLLR